MVQRDSAEEVIQQLAILTFQQILHRFPRLRSFPSLTFFPQSAILLGTDTRPNVSIVYWDLGQRGHNIMEIGCPSPLYVCDELYIQRASPKGSKPSFGIFTGAEERNLFAL